MARDVRRAMTGVRELPVLTVGNLALALLGLPLFVFLLGTFNVDIPAVWSIGIQWVLAAFVVGIAMGGEGLSVSDIGFRKPGWIDLGYIALTSVVVLLVFSLTDPVVESLGLPVQEGAGVMSAGVGFGVAIARAVTTGIVEEILYRGYPIERLLSVTDSPLIAGVATWIVFTLAHSVSWPIGNLVQVALVAAVFTVVYLRRRTLVPVIGAHVFVWVFSVLGQFYG